MPLKADRSGIGMHFRRGNVLAFVTQSRLILQAHLFLEREIMWHNNVVRRIISFDYFAI